MRALRVNETKVISRNAFIDNLFALEREKESKNDERTLFRDFPRILDLSLTLRPRTPHICGFLDCFSFSRFSAISSCFQNLRLSSLNSELNFGQNKSNLCGQDVLVCCCAANQYSEIGCNFSKILKNNACSKG